MVITDKSLVITFAIPVFFLLILIEYIYGKYVGKNTYRLNDTFRSELETTDYNKKQWDATGELPIDAQEAFAGSFPKQVFSK